MKYLWLFIIILITSTSNAQHCRWDGASIMVIAVQWSDSDTVSINNVSISVADSLGNPCYYPFYYYAKPDTIQVKVFQNQVANPVNPKTIKYLPDIRYFWFAGNHYVLQAPDYFFHQKGLQLIIDINAPNIKRRIVQPLNAEYAFLLCSNYSNWEAGPGNELMDGFKIMRIVLSSVNH